MPSYRRQMTLFAHLNKNNNFSKKSEDEPQINNEEINNQIPESFSEEAEVKEGIDSYLKEISKYPLLSKEEEHHSIKLAHQGDQIARNKVLNANLRLVVRIARRYMKQTGMTFPDLIEEGNLGLIHALEKFDISLGHRFSTYAAWWIQQNIERAIMNQSRVVRLPVHIIKDLNKCQRAYHQLMNDQNQKPTFKEIAKSIEKTEDRVEHVLQFQESAISLDIPFLQITDRSIAEELFLEEHENPYKALEQTHLLKLLETLLDSLPENHYAIIIRRFGLRGHDSMTLDAIATELDLTRETVRQIQFKAIDSIYKQIKHFRD